MSPSEEALVSGAYARYLPLLQKGDRVAVITPAGPADLERLDRGCELLRAWGLVPVLGRHVDTGSGLTAGGDNDRARDLQWALTAPDIAAVLCGRGGYGSIRIIDRIDWSRVAPQRPEAPAPLKPKPVIGFSDITGLHAALRRRLGWPSILGPHVAGSLAAPRVGLSGALSPEARSDDSLRALLFDGRLSELFTPTSRAARNGQVRGVPFMGGNLALLAAMVGSPEGEPPPTPFVAILEDVNEAPYRIDRMLTQLLRAGWFDNAVGVVCGSWVGCHGRSHDANAESENGDPRAPRSQLENVLLDRLESVPGPLVFDAPFGHSGLHLPLPLGIPMDLDTTTRTIAFAAS